MDCREAPDQKAKKIIHPPKNKVILKRLAINVFLLKNFCHRVCSFNKKIGG